MRNAFRFGVLWRRVTFYLPTFLQLALVAALVHVVVDTYQRRSEARSEAECAAKHRHNAAMQITSTINTLKETVDRTLSTLKETVDRSRNQIDLLQDCFTQANVTARPFEQEKFFVLVTHSKSLELTDYLDILRDIRRTHLLKEVKPGGLDIVFIDRMQGGVIRSIPEPGQPEVGQPAIDNDRLDEDTIILDVLRHVNNTPKDYHCVLIASTRCVLPRREDWPEFATVSAILVRVKDKDRSEQIDAWLEFCTENKGSLTVLSKCQNGAGETSKERDDEPIEDQMQRHLRRLTYPLHQPKGV